MYHRRMIALETVFIPGFPPAIARRSIEGERATLVTAEGPRVGVFRASIAPAEVARLAELVPDAIDAGHRMPDMPVLGLDLRTETRTVHLSIPLAPPVAQLQPLFAALAAIDQALLSKPLQTARATLALSQNEARVTLVNDGTVPTLARIASIEIIAAPKLVIVPGVAPLPVTPECVGTMRDAELRVLPGEEATIVVDVREGGARGRVFAARLALSFDVSSAGAVAPDGTNVLQARLQTPDVAT